VQEDDANVALPLRPVHDECLLELEERKRGPRTNKRKGKANLG
jgi:hypothetical protein